MLAEVIPSHQLAIWLLTTIDSFLDKMGLSHDKTIEEIIYVALIVGVAMLIAWVLRRVILFFSRKVVKLRNSEIGADLLQHKVMTHVSHIIPPLVVLALIPFAFPSNSTILHIIEKILFGYTAIVAVIAINAVLTFVWTRYDKKENTRNLPLKGILNVCKGIVWIVGVIVMVSVLVGKSPGALLAGLGAFAAVVSLIFKDTILGFVAGIQLAENDMLRVGDWIVVPSTIANGICIDVSLTAVKVRNWDNTIVTLPPYTLVSTSFQNWRGMSDSGYRLIDDKLLIDCETVVPASPELIEKVKTLPGMSDFIAKVENGGDFYDPGVAVVNGTVSTNLGLFRAYLCAYLLKHPLVGTDQQILVNTTAPTPNGLPLQIYCYTTTAWTAYEAVQSDILEHATSMAPVFGIGIYNSPAGKNIDSVAHALTLHVQPQIARE